MKYIKKKKFISKTGKLIEVIIDLNEEGEGNFEYSVDGGVYDYIGELHPPKGGCFLLHR